ncbi:metalloregulator ArsR/SmtB family transcription factor [Tsukamurella sp. 8F]|uniref:ArsR/SmtB family transcription factor n=1 Tax=unclassified Tsukamurella TaxID=2633480 RepID=UPI0023B9F8FB|nr:MULTISPECIES: metalloregulator ArsR/SmtB family transcription factor [unclassified Tsukamurella]MDF0531029.1 metalloregulator ArsR/SmtB family transcription factor [Tsukamurella sp. 8J]MDF0589272.1 metalloregulator ArsR/SmtB family transcription factor [Tsukamurella sp. 8F]
MTYEALVGGLLDRLHPLFRALGEPLRMAILRTLLEHPDGLTVTELVDALDVPQSTVSRHLAVLRHAAVVDAARDGTSRVYTVTVPHQTLDALDTLTETIRECVRERHPKAREHPARP